MQKNTIKETCIVNSIVLFILIVSFSITLFITDKLGYYIMLAVSFVLLLTHSKKIFLNMSTKYLFLILLLYLLKKLPYGLGVASFMGLLLIGIKLFPIFTLGRILIALSPLTIMSSLRKIGISNNFNLSVATGLRFMGEMNIRLKEIRNGMKVRGLAISLLHPIRSFELYLIPLMYKCLHVSETLTSSIISKGAEYEIEKTSYNSTKYSVFDLFCICISIYLVWRVL
ncbi:energy-coupling factor transporter transmembrane component T [uncultured Solobacterium sp.]|uniref:energy-coupling factor transporter transmembrane component T n=1 Tax=uncultured Solobacterium sp. TaxID=747375 RepID=UPI0028D01768|nr:energy-coupling factor transporter transmembrane component T [uncultured Solobacterium sp.]